MPISGDFDCPCCFVVFLGQQLALHIEIRCVSIPLYFSFPSWNPSPRKRFDAVFFAYRPPLGGIGQQLAVLFIQC